MRLKCLLFISVFVFLPSISWAETRTAASCSLADVTAAYNSASAGDVVAIPAGSCSWSSTLTIGKAITLQGAGKDSTVIVNNGVNPLIRIHPGSNLPIRVSSIGFDNTSYVANSEILIKGSYTGAYELSQIRIDNCKFNTGKRAIHATGWVEGVIDHNEFLNCEIAIGISGDSSTSWDRPIAVGTADFLFIEDNTFTVNNSFPGSQYEPEQQVYQQEGGRSVTRYNTFDGRSFNGNFHAYDSHGNQDYYHEEPNGGFRGQPIVEVYENTMQAYKSYRLVDLRGGSVLYYNNTMSSETGAAPFIDVTEEDSWSTSHFPSGLDNSWPGEDQFTNSFLWGNTTNGNPLTNVWPRMASDTAFIQEDRDYFMHAPQSSGGKTTYTGRSGAAGNSDDGTLVFSSSGANAYYPYTPYTYPHPLTAIGDSGGISAPTGAAVGP